MVPWSHVQVAAGGCPGESASCPCGSEARLQAWREPATVAKLLSPLSL